MAKKTTEIVKEKRLLYVDANYEYTGDDECNDILEQIKNEWYNGNKNNECFHLYNTLKGFIDAFNNGYISDLGYLLEVEVDVEIKANV